MAVYFIAVARITQINLFNFTEKMKEFSSNIRI